ncbi:MAG: hypothetical protein WCJ64_03190 [Rhodospirillaceae bacterium]
MTYLPPGVAAIIRRLELPPEKGGIPLTTTQHNGEDVPAWPAATVGGVLSPAEWEIVKNCYSTILPHAEEARVRQSKAAALNEQIKEVAKAITTHQTSTLKYDADLQALTLAFIEMSKLIGSSPLAIESSYATAIQALKLRIAEAEREHQRQQAAHDKTAEIDLENRRVAALEFINEAAEQLTAASIENFRQAAQDAVNTIHDKISLRSLFYSVSVAVVVCTVAGVLIWNKAYDAGNLAGTEANSWLASPAGQYAKALNDDGSLASIANCGYKGWQKSGPNDTQHLCFPHVDSSGSMYGIWLPQHYHITKL